MRPSIEVSFHAEDMQLKGVSLVYSPKGFSCRFEGKVAPALRRALEEFVASYLAKKPFPFPHLPFVDLPPFYRTLLAALHKVPFGTCITYGKLASLAGSPKAARAAGTACRLNPYPFLIPCHRVVATTGLGGFSFDHRVKEELLLFEESRKLGY